ncbi:hypothetical protein DY000_02026372 [Brassica cretica]|uniref:Uncharacterized protein n=1 Tax=Brassica cretica TaxID=69181 RepID=A0ABQ7E700_BRACR|nr:hypothetical protein DY000_02026372 [Brassica cretica]
MKVIVPGSKLIRGISRERKILMGLTPRIAAISISGFALVKAACYTLRHEDCTDPLCKRLAESLSDVVHHVCDQFIPAKVSARVLHQPLSYPPSSSSALVSNLAFVIFLFYLTEETTKSKSSSSTSFVGRANSKSKCSSIKFLKISSFLTVGGPKAACIGFAGFATFFALIEKFFDRHT